MLLKLKKNFLLILYTFVMINILTQILFGVHLSQDWKYDFLNSLIFT